MGNNNDYVWIRSDGRVFGLKNKKSCLICKHCTDIFWDYTHGPYMLFCEKACNFIPKKQRSSILYFLHKKNIKTNEHLHGKYWIYLKNIIK